MLFRKKIEPRCSYCARGGRANDHEVICAKKGIVPAESHCGAFRYDPLKRVPPRPAKLETEEKNEETNDYIFEPDAKSVLENMVQLYLDNMVYSVLLEAKVSEQASRMTAMSTATDATGDLISELSLKLNRVRQAAITTEIAEIVGGANALKKAKK